MDSSLLNLLASTSSYVVALAALIVVVKLSQPSTLDAIPTVGSSSWVGSWWASLKYLINAPDILQEGYKKHKPAPFKVAEFYRWTVVLTSREHIDELQRAPDDTLSFMEAVNDLIQSKYTMGPEILHNPYHVPIMRLRLTRNNGTLPLEMRNEITTAFDDVLDLRCNEWKSVSALSSVQQLVCRTSNRVFVGLPLCRDPGWIDLNIQYGNDVIKGAVIIGFFPDLLKPMACWFFTNINQRKKRGMQLLRLMIEERQKSLNEYGNEWADKPNDLLSWLMEAAEGPELTVKSLTTRILASNFLTVQTTSHSFTHVLFYLAANPQYIQPLREEVETVIETEGWSKVALGKMRKVDSFVKECQRLEGSLSVGLPRKALKDFTFSDGTFVPKGTTILAPIRSIHYDEEYYGNAYAFEPFRFADLREEDGEGMKYQFTSTTTNYLPFGHGRHACPGRFFVANILKSMLAHVVTMYDVKLVDNETRPPTLHFAVAMLPDPNARLMFRRRVG